MARKPSLGVQTAVRLPADLYERLKQSPLGVSGEIRRRLELTFDEQRGDAETLKLVEAILNFATDVSLQTGHRWHAHPAANRVLRHMITARLARLKPEGEAVFRPDELPKARLVAPDSDDPETMGLALEAVDFHTPPMTPERQDRLDRMRAEFLAEIVAKAAKDAEKKGDDDGKA